MKQVWRCDQETEKNISLAFVLKTDGRADLLRVAASGSFRIFADQKLIFKGPLRGAHGQSYLYSLPLPLCSVLVAEVSHAGICSYSEVKEQPFFAAEVFCGKEKIADSDDFQVYRLNDKVQKVQRYSFQRTFVESYRLAQDRSTLLGEDIPYPKEKSVLCRANRLSECPLSLPQLSEVGCTEAEAGRAERGKAPYLFSDRCLTEAGHGTVGGFCPQDLEECLSDELCALHYYREEGKERDAEYYRLYDFGGEIAGFPKVVLCAEEDCTIYLTFDEILWNECPSKEILGVFHEGAAPLVFSRMGTVSGVKYRLARGEYTLLCAEVYSFRWLKVSVLDGRAKIRDVKAVLYENPDVSLRFGLQGELSEIVCAAQKTFAHNAVDVPTDCPSRERAGWLCDSYFTGRAERWLTGYGKVEGNFLRSFCAGQDFAPLPSGMLPMCYPADHPDGVFIPNWAMWYVLELKEYVEATGDLAIAEQSRERVLALAKYLSRFRNEAGLLEGLEGWVFIEWSRANDFIGGISYPTNMLYAGMLSAIGQLYRLEEYSRQAEALRERIRADSFDGTWFRDHAERDEKGKMTVLGDISETCQYYAFYFGVADFVRDGALASRLFDGISPDRDEKASYPELAKSNSFIGNTLRFNLLAKIGNYEQLLKEMTGYFLPMARRTGTLWEHADAQASCDHGFASIAAVWIVQAVTGIVRIDARNCTVACCENFVSPASAYTMRIPVAGQELVVSVKEGKREIFLPQGFRFIKEDDGNRGRRP